MSRPLEARVDLGAIKSNLNVLSSLAPDSMVMAVLKANAYGHGTAQVGLALNRADAFAVISIDEAIVLRNAGITKPIVLLEGFFSPHELYEVYRYQLTPVLHCKEQVEALERATFLGRLNVIVKLNTGMNRLGFNQEQFSRMLRRLEASDKVANIMLMTHFASADRDDGIREQLNRFDELTKLHSYPHCLANSAATIRFPDTHRAWIRLGIAMYGGSPFSEQHACEFGLRAAMKLQSEIIGIQELSAGNRVGYGETFVADKTMRIGVVACGYADGYPRHAGTGTPVAVNGIRTRLLGRVSMDMLCVDLTGIDYPYVGMPVELWGESVTVDEVAQAAGTIGYELLSGLTKRVPVVYENA